MTPEELNGWTTFDLSQPHPSGQWLEAWNNGCKVQQWPLRMYGLGGALQLAHEYARKAFGDKNPKYSADVWAALKL